jgi:hypothetical protein
LRKRVEKNYNVKNVFKGLKKRKASEEAKSPVTSKTPKTPKTPKSSAIKTPTTPTPTSMGRVKLVVNYDGRATIVKEPDLKLP